MCVYFAPRYCDFWVAYSYFTHRSKGTIKSEGTASEDGGPTKNGDRVSDTNHIDKEQIGQECAPRQDSCV
jgi:hypothetical protein